MGDSIILHKGIIIVCRVCNTMHTIMVKSKGYEEWKQGELIQRALPELSASDRELLISQTCPKCWDEMFPEEDEL